MSTSTKLEDGIVIAKEVFAQLDQRGTKWRNRNVPAYIRTQLWLPYYITEKNGEQQLYIIQAPSEMDDKVHFSCWEPPSLR